jgi:hypothetical protein
MGWQNISIFLPKGDEPSPFRYDSMGRTTRNPGCSDWPSRRQPAASEPECLIRLDIVMKLTQFQARKS